MNTHHQVNLMQMRRSCSKAHRTTEEEMEGPISFWGYKEQESNLILPEHDDDDDEMELLNQHTPRKSLIQKGEKCKDMKLSMERLSVFWCCSATNEKLKSLVISNAVYPLEFQEQETDDKHLPFNWCSNKKWWAIQTIFEEWLET